MSGTVYRAFDERRGETVAVKFLTDLEPGALYRFKAEFRSLSTLSHPHLLQLYELLSHGRDWLLTMELIEGTNFLDYVRPHEPTERAARSVEHDSAATFDHEISRERSRSSSYERPESHAIEHVAPELALRRLDLARLRQAFLQLSDGLHALHRAGRLHRDLKPANVLVSSSDKRVVICDFGLALVATRLRPAANDSTFDGRHEVAGTPAFMSPEQGEAGPLTAASDWYAVGVMLYLALTGRMPFEPASDHRSARAAKLAGPPRDPREYAPLLSPGLSKLALALLHPEPARRAGYPEVMATLEGPSATVIRSAGAQVAFVGREAQLAQLEAAFAASRVGPARLVLLRGSSGIGKSALAQHALNELERRADALVLRARCYQHEDVPYKALDPLLDALTGYLMALADERAERLLPSGMPLLAAMFPTLYRVRAVSTQAVPEVVDPRDRRRQAFRALRYLCRNLARQRPLVLFIDDVQWGDQDSARALEELLCPPDSPPLLLICAYRKEDENRSPLVRMLRGGTATEIEPLEITLDALAAAEAERLARALLPDAGSDAHVERIVREAEGIPFFVAELAAGPDGAPLSGLETLFRRKFAGLSPESRDVLALVALAGRPLALATLREASGLGSGIFKALRQLEQQRLIVSGHSSDGDVVECAHDRVREAVFGELRGERAERLHRALARAFETEPTLDCETLLEHWRRAGDHDKAAHYARIAAQRAEAALAFTRAIELYQKAHALLPSDHPAGRDLRERLGHMLILAGRGVEAAEVFTELAHAAPPDKALGFQLLATTQLLRGGKLTQGYSELERAEPLFGVQFPRSAARALTMFVTRQVKIRLRERRFVLNPSDTADADTSARLDALWEVAAAVANADFVRGNVYAGELMLRAMEVGDPSHVAVACGLQSIVAAGSNESARAQRMFDLAERAAAASGRTAVWGRVKGMQAVCRYLQGQWRQARSLARESQELRQRGAGLNWDHAITIWWELMAAAVNGQVSELVRRVPEALRDAEARGDVYAATEFRSHRAVWAWLGPDRPELADYQVGIAERQWLPTGYQFQHWHMSLARIEIDLYRRTPAASFERLQRDWPRALLLRNAQGPRVEMRYARARLALALALTEPRRGPLLAQARADGRALRAERVPWAVALGDMIETAVATFDDAASAGRRLALLEQQFEAVDMPLHVEVCRARRAELSPGPDQSLELDAALASIQRFGVANPRRFLDLLLPVQLPLS